MMLFCFVFFLLVLAVQSHLIIIWLSVENGLIILLIAFGFQPNLADFFFLFL